MADQVNQDEWIECEHKETKGKAKFTRRSFESAWKAKGWAEVKKTAATPPSGGNT